MSGALGGCGQAANFDSGALRPKPLLHLSG